LINTNEGPYEYVKAIVTEDGISLKYKCSELDRPGSDFIDEDQANTWTDAEIQKVVALQLGITSGSKEIEVIFD
jgi:hypothetical protein